MQIVKTSIIVLCLLMVTGSLMAQEKQSPLSFGVRAGANYAGLFNSGSDEFDSKYGFQAGAFMNYEIPKNFYLEVGLNFSRRNIGEQNSGSMFMYDNDMNVIYYRYLANQKHQLTYLQIPLLAGYRFKLSKDLRINLTGGLYAAYGIRGKTDYTLYESTARVEEIGEDEYIFLDPQLRETIYNNVNAFNGTYGNFHRFDMGLSAGAGIEYKNFSLNLGYDQGIYNVRRFSDSAITHTAHLTLGYRIFK